MRSACFFGVQRIIASEKNCAALTPVASKASAGALEHVPIHNCANLANSLTEAAAQGWQVLGAAGAGAGASQQSGGCGAIDRPTVLVVGNEGAGLRTNVKRACTGLVHIPMAPMYDVDVLESLNVSVATGVLLQALRGQQMHVALQQ